MKEKLIKLIKENPDLDIVTMTCTDDVIDDYGYILQNIHRIEVTDIYNSLDGEKVYFDKHDIIEELEYELEDKEEYIGLSDMEFSKLCEEKATEYFYKKAIVIWTEGVR